MKHNYHHNTGRFIGYYYGVAPVLAEYPEGDAGDYFLNGETCSVWIWDIINNIWVDTNRVDSGLQQMLTDTEGNSPSDYVPSPSVGIKEAYFYVAENADCDTDETASPRNVTFTYFKNGNSSVSVEVRKTSIIILYWNGDYWESSVVPMNVDLSPYAKNTDLQAEITRAKAAEQENAEAIAAEQERAVAAEQANAASISTEVADRIAAITALNPQLLRGTLYLSSDSTRIYKDALMMQEYDLNEADGAGVWLVKDSMIVGFLIQGWYQATIYPHNANYMLHWKWDEGQGRWIWENTPKTYAVTPQEKETWNNAVSKLDDFLTSVDATDNAINKWKELENFLAGITDTDTLTGLLYEQETRLNNSITEETLRATGAEAGLQVSINANNESLQSESVRAQQVEGNLLQSINTNKSNIENESVRAKNAEQALENKKADKVVAAQTGNLAGLDATGNLTDSGISAAKTETHTDIMPAASAANAGRTYLYTGTADGGGTFYPGNKYICRAYDGGYRWESLNGYIIAPDGITGGGGTSLPDGTIVLPLKTATVGSLQYKAGTPLVVQSGGWYPWRSDTTKVSICFTMPTASADNEGMTYFYIGSEETDTIYSGNEYVCQKYGDGYRWVPPGGCIIAKNGITGNGGTSLITGTIVIPLKTVTIGSITYYAGTPLIVQNGGWYSWRSDTTKVAVIWTLPEASADNEGMTFLCLNSDDTPYKRGFYTSYKTTEGQYSWRKAGLVSEENFTTAEKDKLASLDATLESYKSSLENLVDEESARAQAAEQKNLDTVNTEIFDRISAIAALDPKLLKGTLYLSNDSTVIYSDENRTKEYTLHNADGAGVWLVKGSMIVGFLIQGWVQATIYPHNANYMLHWKWDTEQEKWIWENTPKTYAVTPEEKSLWNTAVSKLNDFLTSADATDTAINKWKELENFLAGITDTDTLTGLLYELETNLNDDISAETVRATTAEQSLQNSIDSLLANKSEISDIDMDEIDSLGNTTISGTYIVKDGAKRGILLFENTGNNAQRQTLYIDNILKMRNRDAGGWGEWSTMGDFSNGLATVATTGSYNDLSGKPSLSTVATTGSYDSLSDKPLQGSISLDAADSLSQSYQNGVYMVTDGGMTQGLLFFSTVGNGGLMQYLILDGAIKSRSGSYTGSSPSWNEWQIIDFGVSDYNDLLNKPVQIIESGSYLNNLNYDNTAGIYVQKNYATSILYISTTTSSSTYIQIRIGYTGIAYRRSYTTEALGNKEWTTFVHYPWDWDDLNNNPKDLNNFTEEGIYFVKGTNNGTTNLPITNTGDTINVSFTLLVSVSKPITLENGTERAIIGQNLTLANRIGSENKQYLRHAISDTKDGATTCTWGAWKEVVTQTLLGGGSTCTDAEIDAAIDNGIYSGVTSQSGILPAYSTFTMVVVNNYAATAAASAMGVPSDWRQVTQTFIAVPLSTDGQINGGATYMRTGIGGDTVAWGNMMKIGMTEV